MTPTRKIATAGGACYFITHVTSIPALLLYTPVLDESRYILGSGGSARILWGAFLEGICILAIIGTAVTLFPVLKRQNEGVALGYAALRTLEAAFIAMGIVTLLAVVTLRQDRAGLDEASLVVLGQGLVAVHDWTFLLGPAFVLGVNTVLLAYLMYRSGLVPRFIGLLGLVGGPLIFASATATLFDLYDQVSAAGLLAAVPVFAWEVLLAYWLVVKGFRGAVPQPAAGLER